MPKTRFQNIIFTLITATLMAYNMIVYSVAINSSTGLINQTFLIALKGFPIEGIIVFVLAYFVQVKNKIQCQNCGNMFAIGELDNLEEDGCNPISIEDKQTKDKIITIGTKQLKDLKPKFENWKGPKA